MKKLRSSIFFGICCLIMIGAAVLLYRSVRVPEIAEITILQTTDVHGVSSFALFGPVISKERAADPDLLLIDCGDLTQGTLETSLDNGRHMIDAANTFGYDVWVPGNHDFDYGSQAFLMNAERFSGTVLAANLTYEKQRFEDWKMFERNGVKIAVIGCVPPYLGQWIAIPQLNGIETENPEQMLQRVLPEVRRAKPDVIILAIHLGEFMAGRLHADGKPRNMGSMLYDYPDIVLVLAGHSHESVSGKKLRSGAWFVQPPHAGQGIMKVRIQYNRKTHRVQNIVSEILPPADHPYEAMPESWLANAKLAENERNLAIAVLPDEMVFAPVRNSGTDCPLARFYARSMRLATNADAGFSMTYSKYTQTGGRLTGDTLFRLVPYENFITVLSLNTDELKRIRTEQLKLKQQQNYLFEDGIRFELSPDGKQAVKVFKDDREITGNQRITAAFGSYAVSGAGGRYPELKKIAESGTVDRRDTDQRVRQAFRAYISKQHGQNQNH